MSVFNGKIKHLQQAVESILSQTYSEFEFIIVNDGSQKYINDYLYTLSDKRVKIIQNQQNIGLTNSLNLAIKQATGKYIARMDADDIALSERFEKQLSFLEMNTDYILCGSMFYELMDDSKINQRLKFFSTDKQIRDMIIWYNPFCHSSVMFDRSIYDQVGGYNAVYRYSQDYALWLKMIHHGKVYNLNEPLIIRRMDDNISTTKEKEQKLVSVKIRYDAIVRGDFSWWYLISLVRPFIIAHLPMGLKTTLRTVKYKILMRNR